MLKSIYTTLRMGSAASQLSEKSAADTLDLWRNRSHDRLIYDAGRAEIGRYFEAVDHLLPQPPNTRAIDENPTATAAMARLKSEFKVVLGRQSDNNAGFVSTTEWSSIADSTANIFRYEDYSISEPPTADVFDFLHNIAERMNSRGKIEDCVRVYKSVRIPFLQAQLHKKLRFQELNKISNLNKHVWDELKVKIEVWIQLSKICVKKLFEREKLICDRIFQGIGDNSAKDQCFVETVNEFAVGLFGFVETMSKVRHEYERMDAVLALYSAFLCLLQDVEALFSSKPGQDIICKCVETQSRIESEVGRMLHHFENKILEGTLDVSDERGGVDCVTEYVMKQLQVLVQNKDVLTQFIKSPPPLTFDNNVTIPEEDLGDVANRTHFQRHLILILIVLRRKLEQKSDVSTSLAQTFMMNNIHYIVKKIEATQELKQMIGDAYFRELQNRFNFAKDTLKASIDSKFLNCFKDDSLYINPCCFRQRPSKTAYRNNLIEFNKVYEEIQCLQSIWRIPDNELREDIQVTLCAELVIGYKEFLQKFMNNPEIEQIRRRDMKHSADDLEALISNLFADAENVV